MSSDEVLIELAWIGRSDVKDMFGDDRKMLHPRTCPESIRRAIAGVDVKARAIKVRFWSKTEAAIWRESITSFLWTAPRSPAIRSTLNALVRDEDLARVIDSSVSRAQEAKGGGTNGDGNS